MFSSKSPPTHPLLPSPPENAQATQNMLFGTWRNIFKTKAQLDQWCSNYVVWHSDDVCFSTAPKEFKLKWTDLLGHVEETRAHDLTLTVTGFTRMMSRLSFIYYKEARDIFGINLKQTRDMSSTRKLWPETFRETNETNFADEYMKDHIFELQRKIWIYDWSSQAHTQLKQWWNYRRGHGFESCSGLNHKFINELCFPTCVLLPCLSPQFTF